MAKKAAPKNLAVSEVAVKLREQYFPLKLGGGVTCEAVSMAEASDVIKKNFSKVFGELFVPRFTIKKGSREWTGVQQVRQEYGRIHTEAFLFKKNGKAIGWCIGEIDDFETFYMRNTGILTAYRGKGFYGKFLKIFLQYLKHLGYQRVSSQHLPINAAIYAAKMSEGFMIVGSENHELWGQLVKMVKIFNPKREKVFRERFF